MTTDTERPNASDLANKAEREAAYRAENASSLERAARAIGEVYDGYADPVDTPNNWARAVDGARAALMAIRPLSDELRVRAVGECSSKWEDVAVWQGIIDAILAEEPAHD